LFGVFEEVGTELAPFSNFPFYEAHYIGIRELTLFLDQLWELFLKPPG
jgi:hypothetical protein